MILFLLILAKVCPFRSGKQRLKSWAARIRRQCYGGLSMEDVDSLRAGIFSDVQQLLVAAKLHAKTFRGYKDSFIGKDVVLVGAGPSVAKFEPMPDCVYVGLNRACSIAKIHFDYLFAMDYRGIKNYKKEFAEVDCVKFVGDQGADKQNQIPESDIAMFGEKVFRYRTDSGHLSSENSHFAVDLETQALGNFHTVAMQAMQFILYGHPRRIYLAGIDCSSDGHFDANKNSLDERRGYSAGAKSWAYGATADWARLKDFAEAYYPDIEIISINPVGLKGLFRDLFP